MAHMPTTRRGRYEFFRARAQARHLRLSRNAFRPSVLSNHLTSRTYQTDHLRMQFPKVYGPPDVISPRPPFFWLGPGKIKPRFKLLPRAYWVFGPPPHGGPDTHWTFALVNFLFRKVHHVPPLKHLPRKPYALPLSAIPADRGYPFMTYPSGQHNPRGWIP